MSRGDPASDDLRSEESVWREATLRGIGYSLALAMAGAGVWMLAFPVPTAEVPIVLIVGALMTLVIVDRRVPLALPVRASVVLGALYLPCATALLRTGYTPNAFVGFSMVIVSGALVLGRRVGLLLTALCVVTVAGISLLHEAHLVERVPGWIETLDSSRRVVWPRVTFVFALVTTTLVIAISYLLSRFEQLVRAKALALETLRLEQIEKERIARELARREAAFRKARELELLGRLAGTMAHDFNNALLVIFTALDEVAELAELPPAANESVSAIRHAADQAAATTKQLRAFGPASPRRATEVALAPLIEKATRMFARLLPQDIQLHTELSCDAVVSADEGELLRILMNLALNARDAMRDGGVLRVRGRAASDHERLADCDCVAIDIADTGSGMSDDVKARLFEPYFTTKAANGTGLGLASVREIAEAHGGCVLVASELGVGTTITVIWPRLQR